MNSRYFEKLKVVASVSPDKIDTLSQEDLEYMNLRLFTQKSLSKKALTAATFAASFLSSAQKSISS